MPLAIESDDLTPLPYGHRQGLIAVAVLASLSFGLCTIVLLYLTYKLIRWHINTRWRRTSACDTEPVDLSLGLAERHFTGTTDDGTQGRRSRRKRGKEKGKKPYPNQFLVLVYNLLLADLHQAGAFLLNGVWASKNGIEVHNPACFLQGWLVSTGDLSSSCFITAIAVHTYLGIVWNYKPPQRLLYLTIVGLWVFDYTLAILGPVTTNNGAEHGGFYVRAAAWCWVSVKFETHRLVLHYLFIFISLAITSVLYILIFLSLRRRSSKQQNAHSRASSRPRLCEPSPTSTISRPDSIYRSDPESHLSSSKAKNPLTTADVLATIPTANPNDSESPLPNTNDHASGHHKAFLLYPVIYVVCTAPLALGRIATMAKVDVPISYFCVAGALIGSNGWLDVLLWGVTRQNLLFGSDVGSEETGLDTFTFMRTPHDRRYGNIVWVEGAVNEQQQQRENGGEVPETGSDGREGNSGGNESSGRGASSRRQSWRSWLKWLLSWDSLDVSMASFSSEKSLLRSRKSRSRRRHKRSVSQESLRTTHRSIRHHHQHSQDLEGLSQPMSGGIHMDLVTSVVVVERPDLEQENREYLERQRHTHSACGAPGDGGKQCLIEYCKSMGMDMTSSGLDNLDLPELQDPSGYLTPSSADDLPPAGQQIRHEDDKKGEK